MKRKSTHYIHLITCLFTLSFFSQQLVAQVVVDSVSRAMSPVGQNTTSITWSHTTGTGTNRFLLVTCAADGGTVSSVTYNGVALTKGPGVTGMETTRNEIWYMVNPPSGTFNVVFSNSANEGLVGCSISFTGVDQANPLGTPATSNPTVKAANDFLTVTTFPGDMAVDVITLDDTKATVGAGQTVRYNPDPCANGFTAGATSTKAAVGSTTTMSWDIVDETCAHLVVPVLSAACAGGPVKPTSVSSSTGTSSCSGQISTLTVVGGSLGTSGQWQWYSGSCGGGASLGTGTTLTVSPSVATTYYVRGESGICVTECASIALVPSSISAPVIYATPSGVCNGSSVTLDIVNNPCVGGGCNYVWSTGQTGISIVVAPTGPITYTVTISNSCGNNVTGTVNICGGATGLTSLADQADHLTISPNPSNGTFTFFSSDGFSENSVIKIYNLLGDEMAFSTSTGNLNKKEISLVNKTPGIYFVHLETQGKTYTVKLAVDPKK